MHVINKQWILTSTTYNDAGDAAKSIWSFGKSVCNRVITVDILTLLYCILKKSLVNSMDESA